MLDPNESFGQISNGCEIFISPKDWKRSRAELPSLAQQNVDVIPHRISGEERHHLLDNKTDSQGFLRAFVNYFKGGDDETSHQSGCRLPKELDFPAASALTEFRVIPTMNQPKHQLCAFIYSKKVRHGGQLGIRVKWKENVFLVKCHFEPLLAKKRRITENELIMGATLATAYGLKLGDRVTISAVVDGDENFCKGTLKVREDGKKLLAKLCQPFLLADATDICHPNLKFSVSGGDFCGNWSNSSSDNLDSLDET